MAWRGSLSRSLLSTVRTSTSRSSPPLARLRPPPITASRAQSRRFSFTDPRTLGGLAAAQSLMPLHSMAAGSRLTSHLKVDVRACCELSHGT
ncbi:uncharacterized protein LOC116015000 [Ipomoea triloba]|uniref:uncharacterized protein LOC116015000 n=1 Tax=Ipomoea triloba TaxID=35885 RepID=UPI00125D84FB|nr:uncharacterized protein LOC116015000 [Ipomoea triloba]